MTVMITMMMQYSVEWLANERHQIFFQSAAFPEVFIILNLRHVSNLNEVVR